MHQLAEAVGVLTILLCATVRIIPGKAQKSLGFITILEYISTWKFRPAERLQSDQKILVADIAL
jgi:hypothetical protein